ncbi:hypothetical protein E2C01_074178 [Portunus trituberculatus]|uniref:Uncharacterized protein n=1 Tax=Portunus trituberculatus TaxID=210409 RepID=A0A5B7I2Q2_PORTR|nr:hypothetical protein [Portunus trituberculatus]
MTWREGVRAPGGWVRFRAIRPRARLISPRRTHQPLAQAPARPHDQNANFFLYLRKEIQKENPSKQYLLKNYTTKPNMSVKILKTTHSFPPVVDKDGSSGSKAAYSSALKIEKP